MGSILSFPILCLANLGLYLETIKEDTRPMREKLAGVLVNGDDMLYVAPNSNWVVHVENGTKVGLSMSPGKAYHHPVYANANSACYHFDLARANFVTHKKLVGKRLVEGSFAPVYVTSKSFGVRSSTPYSIPFLNSGLYFGQNKVLGGDDVDVEKTFCSTINRLIEGSLPGKAADLCAQFLNRHSHSIKKETLGRNLFLPISVGGMGVTLPDGFKFTVNSRQRMFAKMVVDDTPYATLEQRPHRECDAGHLPDAPKELQAPWLAGLTFEDGMATREESPNSIGRKLHQADRLVKQQKTMLLHPSTVQFGLTLSAHIRCTRRDVSYDLESRETRLQQWAAELDCGRALSEFPQGTRVAEHVAAVYRHRPPVANPFAKKTRLDSWYAADPENDIHIGCSDADWDFHWFD